MYAVHKRRIVRRTLFDVPALLVVVQLRRRWFGSKNFIVIVWFYIKFGDLCCVMPTGFQSSLSSSLTLIAHLLGCPSLERLAAVFTLLVCASAGRHRTVLVICCHRRRRRQRRRCSCEKSAKESEIISWVLNGGGGDAVTTTCVGRGTCVIRCTHTHIHTQVYHMSAG